VHTIDLAYAGLGIHEELVAYVADQQNYYRQEAVHVALRDGRAWDDERLRRTATIGLGRAVLSRLTDGTPWTVLCVNTRPAAVLAARPRPLRVGRAAEGPQDRHPPAADRARVLLRHRAPEARARPGP
jgi:NitT/TauT family transport system substrate-binding protein